tara:strand:- start:16 stop:177 length:162 start_codon:yes stop_codon:yes gene_type:complete
MLNIWIMYTHLIIKPILKTAHQRRKEKLNLKVKRDEKLKCARFEKKKIIITFD